MNSPQHKFFPLALLVLLGGVSRTFSQGTFQNLDFEAAYPNIQPSSTAPGFYAVTTVLPGWNVFYGANQQYAQQSLMGYQIVSTGETFVTLVGATNPGYATSISGRFSVLLQGGVTASSASISQTGVVPAFAQSIQFEGQSSGPLTVSLARQNIPIVAIGTGPNYTLYGGNVAAFAGDTELLQFSVPEGNNGNNAWNIDDIVFSPQSIPEPGTWALMLGGAATLFATSRCKRKT